MMHLFRTYVFKIHTQIYTHGDTPTHQQDLFKVYTNYLQLYFLSNSMKITSTNIGNGHQKHVCWLLSELRLKKKNPPEELIMVISHAFLPPPPPSYAFIYMTCIPRGASAMPARGSIVDQSCACSERILNGMSTYKKTYQIILQLNRRVPHKQ